MIVVVVERVTPGLRGELRQWLLELQSGVFVGRLTKRVREEVWKRLQEHRRSGAATMVYPARNEQGYAFVTTGDPSRTPVDLDGLILLARQAKPDPDVPF